MALEVELEVLKSVVTKLDSSLEKISEVSNSIGKLLAVHDERIGQLEKISERRNVEIEKLQARISDQTREIVAEIEKLETTLYLKIKESSKEIYQAQSSTNADIQKELKAVSLRVETLEKWRMYVIGIAAAAGYLVGNLGDILKLLK